MACATMTRTLIILDYQNKEQSVGGGDLHKFGDIFREQLERLIEVVKISIHFEVI